MKRYIVLAAMISMVFLSSCYRDLGNYDYNRIPEIKIDSIITIVDGGYGTKMLFEDSIIITPVVTFGDEDLSNFEFTWYKEVKGKLVFITNEKDLRILATDGGYNSLVFEAVYKPFNISKRVKTGCDVVSTIDRAWYILKENATGDTELDRCTEKMEEEVRKFIITEDLLEAKFGAPFSGKPVNIEFFESLWHDVEADEMKQVRAIRPVSQHDMAVINSRDFEVISKFEDLFMDKINKEDVTIEAAYSYRDLSCMIYNGGQIRTYPHYLFSAYMLPYSNTKMNTKVIMPLLSNTTNTRALGYDENSSSFVDFSGGGTKINFYTSIPGYQPIKDLNADMLFMGQKDGKIGADKMGYGIGYALLQKRSDRDSLLLYHMSLMNLSMGMAPIMMAVTCDVLTKTQDATLLAQADMYSLHQTISLLYFTIGSKLYTYNINNKTVDQSIVLPDLEGKEISWMKYLRIKYDGSNNREKLIIATHSGGNYEVLMYGVGGTGMPTGEPERFSGKGRAKSIVYAAPMGNSSDLYVYF